MKLGVIGAGNIIPFHLEAALQSGYTLEGIVARNNSTNAKRIADEFGFKRYYASFSEFISNSSSFDAFLIACNSENLFHILEIISPFNKPILIEKPIFTNFSQLVNLDKIRNKNKILVGYNRRFYKTILHLRELIINNPDSYVKFTIPELSGNKSINQQLFKKTLIENSVHMIDLIQFCLGPNAISSHRIKNLKKNNDLAIFDLSDDGLKSCQLSFGYASNYSIEVFTGGDRVEVKPLEIIKTYTDMEIIYPDKEIKFKRYVPKESNSTIISFHENSNLKPGFLAQIQELNKIVQGEKSEIGANLDDAIRVSSFVFELLEQFNFN
jgi:predicted dehydrogenase